jgi:hypothetical protein
MHDGDLRYRTDGQFDFVYSGRDAATNFRLMHAVGPSLDHLGTPERLYVMGLYDGLGSEEGQPAWAGNDPLVYSIYFGKVVAPFDRYQIRADTEDGGQTFRYTDAVLMQGTAAWENVSVYDITSPLVVGDTTYHFYTGSYVSGGVENLDGSIGMVSYKTPVPAQIVPPDPTTGFLTLTDGATVTLDFGPGQALNAAVTLGGNRTLAVTNARSGATFNLYVTQDATGSRTLTLPAGWKVAGGGSGAVSLTTTANAVDLIRGRLVGTVWRVEKVLNFN